MRVFLQAQGAEVWIVVLNRYDARVYPPTDAQGKRAYEGNSKAMNAILSSLTETIFVKVMHCDIAKEVWDKLKNIYEGDDKVRGAKLQTYKGQFENLKMKEEENIATHFLRVDEIVNIIKGLGEKVEEQDIV